MANIPIILLAAGGSSRMGKPKQLLPWNSQTLIEHQIQTLLKTGNPVNVVLGSHSNHIIPVIEKFKINIIINKNWEKGMGSSIAIGVSGLTNKLPDAEGVLFTLLDQPLVTVEYLRKMLDVFQPGKQQIVVSVSDAGWKGVPALFDKCYFDELQSLDGEQGAKIVMKSHAQNVKQVECGNLLEDMDTPEKYQQLLDRKKGIN